MGTDNASLARRYITEIWGKGNVQLIDELVDDNIVLSDPMTAKPVQGKAVMKERLEMMSKDMTDQSITIQETVAAGDVVVIRHRWTGVRNTDFFGVEAKGKRVTCDVVEWIRIKNGKVVENASFFDVYTMFQQLGALPPPEQFKPKETKASAKPATA